MSCHAGFHFQRTQCEFASFHPSDYFYKRFYHETHLLVHTFLLGCYFFRRMVFQDRERENISGKDFIENSAYFSNCQKNKFSQDQPDLASLISSGVNVVEALSITRDVLQNNKYKEVLTRAMDDVQKGVPVSQFFQRGRKNLPRSFGGNDGGRRGNGQNVGNVGKIGGFTKKR